MQNRQTNQVFNFDKFPKFEKDIDLKQRARIEVKGKAIETNVRKLRSKLSKTAIPKTSPLSPVWAFSMVELRALGKVETIFKNITSEAP